MGRIYLSDSSRTEWMEIGGNLRVRIDIKVRGDDATNEKGEQLYGVKKRDIRIFVNDMEVMEVIVNGTEEKLMDEKARTRAFNLRAKLTSQIDEAEDQVVLHKGKSVVIIPDAASMSFTIHAVAGQLSEVRKETA